MIFIVIEIGRHGSTGDGRPSSSITEKLPVHHKQMFTIGLYVGLQPKKKCANAAIDLFPAFDAYPNELEYPRDSQPKMLQYATIHNRAQYMADNTTIVYISCGG